MSRVVVDLPEGAWVEVPLGERPKAWARAVAPTLTDDDPGALARALREVAERAERVGALATAVLLPGEAPAVVVAELFVLQVQCPADPAEAMQALSADDPGDLGTPEVRRVDLPLGPAVRRHGFATAPDGGVLERVEHLVPLGDGSGLLADMSWHAVAAGEELTGLADRAAAGLRLTDD